MTDQRARFKIFIICKLPENKFAGYNARHAQFPHRFLNPWPT